MVFWEYKHTQVLFSQRERKNSVKIKSENGRKNKKVLSKFLSVIRPLIRILAGGDEHINQTLNEKIIKPSENPFRVYLFYPFHFIYNPWRLLLWSFMDIGGHFTLFNVSKAYLRFISITKFKLGFRHGLLQIYRNTSKILKFRCWTSEEDSNMSQAMVSDLGIGMSENRALTRSYLICACLPMSLYTYIK